MNPIDRLLSLIAPYECIACGIQGGVVCAESSEQLIALPNICYVCAKASRAGLACETCKSTHTPQRTFIATEYSGISKELIAELKFKHKRETSAVMARVISDTLPFYAIAPIVTFVPTANIRRRERGFDHAELIAKHVARLNGWLFLPTLKRVGTIQQHGKNRETRKQQVRGTIELIRPIAGVNFIVIDDVLTTGATIEECTKVLRGGGAQSVDAAVFARTKGKS
jgi:ComF family protein